MASSASREPKALILGASGFIGRTMFAEMGQGRAIGTYCKHALAGGVHFDATTMDLGEIVPEPAAIAHAFVLYADSLPDSCARDPARSNALNIDSTKRVIDRLMGWGVPLSFTSSESVHDGRGHAHTEQGRPEPTLLYGAQKLAIEDYLAGTDGAYAAYRLGKVFGANAANEKLFTGWIRAIEAGETIRCATDQVFSPVFVGDVVRALRAGAEGGICGLYNLCGLRPYSRFELLEMVIEEVRTHRPVEVAVERCSIDDFPLVEPRPKDVSMKPDKLVAATGIEITPTREVCRQIVRDYYARA